MNILNDKVLAVISFTKPHWLCNQMILLLSQLVNVLKVKQADTLGHCCYEVSIFCFSIFPYADLGLS